MAAPDLLTFFSITFGTSSFSANITDINWGGISRAQINASHLGTTNDHEFIQADLVDNGEVTVEFQFDGTKSPPIITNGAQETVTIDWGGLGAGNTWAATMGQSGLDITGGGVDGMMTGSIALKPSGAVTIA